MKKILGSAIGIGMLFASAIPTFAATNTTINITGPDSYNKIKIEKNTRVKVNNLQFAYVKNSIHNNTNTGDNKVKDNTIVTGSGIQTGNATSNTTVNNTVNTAFTVVDNCGCDKDTEASIGTTGPDSTNKVYVYENSSVKVNNVQFGVVKNYVHSSNSTGGNKISHNTNVAGGITTGDASSNVVVDNWVNSAETHVGPVTE